MNARRVGSFGFALKERWQVELAHLPAGDRELPRRELLLVHITVAHEVVEEIVGDRLAGGVEVAGDQEGERILAACRKAVEERLLRRAGAYPLDCLPF